MIRNEAIALFVKKRGQDLFYPADATDIQVADLYPMRVQGQCNKMYTFSVTYRLDNSLFEKDFVLRICRYRNEERMIKEYRALKSLKAQGIPVPTPVALELDRNIIGSSFLIMEKINGASVSNFFGDKEKTLAIVDMLAQLLVSLHKVDPQVLFQTGSSRTLLGQAKMFRETMLSELKKRVNIGYITSFSPFVRRKYLKAVMKLEGSEIHGSPLTLVHGDFGPDHVHLSENGPIITDWEGIRWGDPAYDVGWAFHVLKLEGSIMIDHRFVKASKEKTFDFDIGEEFVRCYRKHNGAVPVNLEFYKNLCALKLAAILDLNIRPGAKYVSRLLRFRPQEMLSQTFGVYGTIRAFKRNYESFLRQRSIF